MADPQPTEPAAPIPPKPKGIWGAVLTATPIALTALATAFAGLSSSEMTQAMYHRSLAAQHQSRAGDQWAFFQAKRIRGNGLEATGELLQALGHPEPFDWQKLDANLGRLHSLIEQQKPVGPGSHLQIELDLNKIERAQLRLNQIGQSEQSTQLWSYLTDSKLPTVEAQALPDPAARQAYEEVVAAIAKRQTEAETVGLVTKLSPATIEEATKLAEDDADKFDKACEPVSETVKQLKAMFKDLGAVVRQFRGGNAPAAEAVSQFDQLDASFRAAAMDYEARRYRQEATLNRRAAEAYEVRVRRSGAESDRHRERSKRFFYSMLLAQVGATISALALARAQHSLLWLLAAAAGVVALCFTGYVYLSY